MGIARKAGGLNACQDGLGHLFREVQMGNLLGCGGVKMLARMVWGTYAVKIEVQMGNCLIVEGVQNACKDGLGQL